MDEDDSWSAEPEEEEDVPSAGLSYYDEYLWVNGIRISPEDCPDCLKGDEGNCDLCVFFIPENCRLRGDTNLLADIQTLFSIYRDRRTAQLRRQRSLIRAVRAELKAHGRPLHYTVLARMVADRHPNLRVTEYSVLRIMSIHPKVFERVAEGVYQCR